MAGPRVVAAAGVEGEAAGVSAVLATVVVLSVVEGVRPVAPSEVGVGAAFAKLDYAKTAPSSAGPLDGGAAARYKPTYNIRLRSRPRREGERGGNLVTLSVPTSILTRK